MVLFRAFAGVLVLGAIVHVGTLLPRVRDIATGLPAGAWIFSGAYAACALTALAACGLALLLLWKASHKADGRALTLFLGFLAVFWGSLFRFIEVDAAPDEVSVNLNYGSQWVSQTAIAAWLFATAAFLRFSALFPRPLTADRLRPAKRFHFLRRLRVALLRPWPVWTGTIVAYVIVQYAPSLVARLLGADGAQRLAETQSVMGTVYLSMVAVGYLVIPAIAIVLGVRNLRASYRRAPDDERRRMLWVVMGFSVAAWLIVLAIGSVILLGRLDTPQILSIITPVLFVLAPLMLVIGSALGVLYHGAIDPALAVRRSTLYGVAGVVGIVIFAGIENALSALVERGLALPGFVGPLIAGGIVAAVLIPVQRRMSAAFARRTKLSESASSSDAGEGTTP